MRRLIVFSWVVALAACRSGRSSGTDVVVTDGSADVLADALADEVAAGPFPVLLFSRTVGFRHDSIPAAIQALTELQDSGGFTVEATEDPTQFNADNLARFRVVVFLLTTGDVLDDDQQTAFEGWVGAGGGYLGVHSAADTEYDWPFYGALVGAYFKAHPAVQPANVDVEAADHPAMMGIASPWMRTDEWYDFQTNPRDSVTVLATVDESSYTGGTMGPDHPIAWAHPTTGGGRALYTAMGHTQESYADPVFRQHLTGALRWVAGVE
jgi:type 1 glutamine amidotransferase